MPPFTTRLHGAFRICALIPLILVAARAARITFDTSEYTVGSTVVGVNDTTIAGGAWIAYSGSNTEFIAAPSGVDGRSLRLVDASAAAAKAVYIDSAGTMELNQPFSLGFSFKVSGTHATTGTAQAWVQFGRQTASGWGTAKCWLHFDVNGSSARLWVDPSGNGGRTTVTIGSISSDTYVRIEATVDPTTKTYTSVRFNGVDVTAIVNAAGKIPWRISSTDTAAPGANLWIVGGTDDIVNVEVDNIELTGAIAPIPGQMTFATPEYGDDATVIGVNDQAFSGGAWTLVEGSASNLLTPSTNGNAGGRALRLADTSAAVGTEAYIAVTGTANLTKPVAFSADLRLVGTTPAGTSPAFSLLFGRAPGASLEQAKSWLRLDVVGDDLRLVVDGNSSGDRTPVPLGSLTPGTYRHLQIIFDPVSKRILNIALDRIDLTSRALAVNRGALPWRTSIGDMLAPDENLWVRTDGESIVTIDIDNIRISSVPEDWIAQTSEEWLPFIASTTNMKVAAGSALDFTSLFPRSAATINARGAVHVDQNGNLAFANGESLRLFTAAEYMIDSPVASASTDEQLRDYADQIARAGYNGFRPHFLDVCLMTGSSTALVFNNDRFVRWQKLVGLLRERGIYLVMDAITSWNAFYPESPNAFYSNDAKLRRMKVKLLYDQAARDQWRAGVTQIFTATNPYVLTPYGGSVANSALRYDPQVAFTNLRNEPSLMFQFRGGDSGTSPALRDDLTLIDAWRTWLRERQGRYANVQALNAAWSDNITTYSYASFDTVALPSPFGSGVPLRDLRRFEMDLEMDAYTWMTQTLRDIGVKTLTTDFNNWADLPNTAIRDVAPLVDAHNYHDHGAANGSLNYYWTHDNTSATDSAMLYLRSILDTRQTGKPYTITEWGQVFWNPYRYEGGLHFPSYAALQGWDMIAQHSMPVTLAPTFADIFQIRADPIAKNSEYMAAALFGRGDVAPSPHRVELSFDPTTDTALSDTGGALAWWAKVAPLVTGFSMNPVWPKIVADAFDAAPPSVDASFGAASAFWTADLSPGGTGVRSNSSLVLATPPTANSHAAWHSAPSANGALDPFARTVRIQVTDLRLDAGAGPASERKFRFSLASSAAGADDSASAVVVDITADNVVRLGYKVGAPGSETYRWVAELGDLPTFSGAVTGFALNVVAGDINELSSGALYVPTYDFTVFLASTPGGAGTEPAYRQVQARWTGDASMPALTPENWGSTLGNSLHLSAHNGAATQTTVARIGNLELIARAVAPRASETVHVLKSFEGAQPTSAAFMQELKNVGVLNASTNLTVPPVADSGATLYTGIFHSDTEQLYLDLSKRLFRVVTDRSEGVTLPDVFADGTPAPTSATLPNLRITNLAAPSLPTAAGVLITTHPTSGTSRISDAGRLLLLISTDALNTGQAFSDYKRTAQYDVYNGVKYGGRGQLPVLVKRARMIVRIRNVNAETMKIYPLNVDGTRRNALATTVEADGADRWLAAEIDTGLLSNNTANSPAVAFEVATDSPVSAPIARWRLTYFNTALAFGPSADEADPDGDGLSNLMEYALGTAPNNPDSLRPPVISTAVVDGAEVLALSFTRNRAATDVAYRLETTDDLRSTWSQTDALSTALRLSTQNDTPSAGVDTLRIKDPAPLPSRGTRFLRLSVTPIP